MKKSTIWTIVIVVVVVLVGVGIFAGGWFGTSGTQPATNPTNPTSTNTGTGSTGAALNTTHYFCDSGTLTADFATGTVAIKLSDGRTFSLPQAMSGSGIRYEVGSGTSKDITFQSKGNDAFLTENGSTTYNNCVAGSVMSIASGTVQYTDQNKTYNLTYPDQFTLTGGGVGFTQSWRAQATSQGLLLAKITIPPSFEVKTNFANATFTLGTNADPVAVKSCLTDAGGQKAVTSSAMVNGVQYTRLNFTDVGAGNIYDTTSYRTVRNKQCYAVEYTIHSAQLGNFDPKQGIKAFDETKIQAVLDGIARSVKFL
jgi:membrane-bound inhibitor of C-type lysozyme